MYAAMSAPSCWRKLSLLRSQAVPRHYACHLQTTQLPHANLIATNSSRSCSSSSRRHVCAQALDRRRTNSHQGSCPHAKAHRHHPICQSSVAGTAGSLSPDGAGPNAWTAPRKDWKQVLLSALTSLPLGWMFMFSYIAILLVVPITAMLTKASAIPWQVFIARATEPVAMHAYYVTFTMALFACLINCVFGFILAWVLVKYDFPGKKWLDAAVDLPFALPTSVAGLTLSSVYSEEGILGQFLVPMGVDVVFSRLGVAIAMVFVSFPFVVRTMQPVIQELDQAQVEAAWTLGASNWRTFLDVIFPPLVPALMTGTALAFSRALGEFGSVVIISSNFPFKDLIAPVLIFQALEQYDFVGATVIGTVLLIASLVIMLCINKLQSWVRK